MSGSESQPLAGSELSIASLLNWLAQAPAALGFETLLSWFELDNQLKTRLDAILNDLWQQIFAQQLSRRLAHSLLKPYLAKPPELAALLLLLWLLQAPGLRSHLQAAAVVKLILTDYPLFLSALEPPSLFTDPERQEELLRFSLKQLALQTCDESPTQSAERWEQISSQRQQQLFALLRQHRRREAAVRQAQARQQRQW